MKQQRIWMFVVVMTALLVMACGGKRQSSERASRIMEVAYKSKDYGRVLQLADSLYASGDLASAEAYYWRGYACDRMKKKRMAEFYFKTAIEAASESSDKASVDVYAKAASRLASLLSVRGDYEGTLKTAEPVAQRLEELKADTTSDYVNLLIYIGCCQSATKDKKDATDGFNRAYQKHLDNIGKKHNDAAYKDAFAGLLNIVYYCNYVKNYEASISWIDRFGELLGQYEHMPGTTPDYVDKQLGRFDIYRAIALEGMNKKEEAAKVFEAFRKTHFSTTPEGRIMANDYLIAAKRWDEAADNYSSLDALLAEQQDPYTIDNIRDLLLKKYQANQLAGRRDTAVAVSLQICNSLEDAFEKDRIIDAEEQTTVVEKVEQLNEAKAADNHRRQLGLMGLLALVFLAFIVFTIYRRIAVSRQAKAFKRLKKDFAQLKEDTTRRVSAESTHRIADEVQQLVMPTQLPQHAKLSMRSALIPAKGIGTTIYDCVIRDGRLFMMMGDAAGSEVQALAMLASVKAQFRTAMALETSVERIVSAVDLALSDGRQSGGSMALFVGVLDLSTGQFDYCNAGHQAPLLVGETITPLPVEQQSPVGLQSGATYEAQTVDLPSGTLLLLYSAGLIESVNAEQQVFGEKRLMGDALQASKLNPAPKPFVESILQSLRRFTGDAGQQKDITMLAVRYSG